MKKLILILFCLFLENNLIAGTIDQNVPDSKYVEYGDKHESVVKLEGNYDNKDNTYFYASAVVIKPRWLLTAAHVIKGSKNCRIVVGKKTIPIDFIKHHASYEENKFGKYDIGIGHLKEDANISFYPELYSKDDEVGKICSMAGYGVTGTFQSTERKVDNLKRAGSNTVEAIDRDLLICSLKDGPRTSLEFLICHGDSGGGLFIDKKLAGINSCILTEDKKLDSNINDWSGHTRVSLFIDWVKEVMDTIEKAEQAKP
jgi:hypothetical protein